MRLKWMLPLVLAALLTVGFYSWAVNPLRMQADETAVEFSPGSGVSGIANALVRAHVLHGRADSWRFRLLARVLGRGGSLQAGYYTFHPGDTPLSVLNRISHGQVTLRQVRFIEGWTFAEIRQAMNDSPWLNHDSRDMDTAAIAKAIGLQGSSPEGWIYPDTYDVRVGSSDLALLKRARLLMQTHLAAAWQGRAAGLPYRSPADALIMASIIEKETAQASERPQVAEVFINRLHQGMRLQTDPTVIYGLGNQFDGDLRKQDLLHDTPWNTYTRYGLPPTPIAMPGMPSIEAALHPASGNELYFVSRGNGTHVFSNNLADHNRAVGQFQKSIPLHK